MTMLSSIIAGEKLGLSTLTIGGEVNENGGNGSLLGVSKPSVMTLRPVWKLKSMSCGD